MADFIYYVNPDSAAAGNGTTDSISGANSAYQTLNAAITARAGTHGSGNTITYRCSGNGSKFIDSTAVNVTGHTEDAVIIEGYNGNYSGKNDGAVYDNTAYYALEVNTVATHTLTISNPCTIRYLQIDNTSTSSYYKAVVNSGSGTSNGSVFDSNRIRATKSSAAIIGSGLYLSVANSGYLVVNNTVEGNGNTSASAIGIYPGAGGSGTECICANNTVYSFGVGIRTANFFHYQFYNNVLSTCTNDWLFGGSETITASNNADSNDGDTPGSSNTILSGTITDYFQWTVTGDFRVVSSDTTYLKDKGTSGGSIPTDDIAGNARGATYDIGAWEDVSTGSVEAGAGAAAGTTTAAGIGRATAAAAGAAAGTSTATTAATAIHPAAGVSDGTSTAAAVAVALAVQTAVGAAAGTAAAAAIGRSTGTAAGAAAGVGTATGAASSIGAAVAAATGSATAAGIGASTAEATGAAAGTSTAAALGEEAIAGTEQGAGTAAGTSSATGVGAATAAGAGSAAGTSAAIAEGASTGGVVSTTPGVYNWDNELRKQRLMQDDRELLELIEIMVMADLL